MLQDNQGTLISWKPRNDYKYWVTGTVRTFGLKKITFQKLDLFIHIISANKSNTLWFLAIIRWIFFTETSSRKLHNFYPQDPFVEIEILKENQLKTYLRRWHVNSLLFQDDCQQELSLFHERKHNYTKGNQQ